MAKKKRAKKQAAKRAVMVITAGRKKLIAQLTALLAEIAPATSMGKGFCVRKVAEEKGIAKCWKGNGNKKKMIAELLENTFLSFPQKPKRLVLAIVEGGVEWSARKGTAVSREHLDQIAEVMAELGFKVKKELDQLELPDPSRVAPPPLDLAALIDRIPLHDALRDDCLQMFKDGHLNEAVRKGLERFEKKIQDLTGEHSIGKELMGKAFNRNNPLIAINDGTSGNDGSEQEGFMHLTMGAMAGMRNLYSHGDVDTMQAIDALERLAFISLLFKRVDAAIANGANDE